MKFTSKNIFIPIVSFLLIILIPSLVQATITFVSGDGNNYIRLVAEPGEGDNWDNAFSFEKIVDYFENNPISAISMPSNQDLTEGHGYWAGGVATQASQNSPVNDATVEVDNTTGFRSSGTLIRLSKESSSGYPDYINYTGITSTSFTGCTWDKFYGNYIKDVDPDEWIYDYRKDTISTNTTDYQVGSNSLVYTHDNNGSNAIIMWVGNLESWSESINAYCAEELRFWIKPSSSNITLEEVYERNYYSYSNGRVFYYGNHWTGETAEGGGFNLSAGNWTENRIIIRDYGMDSKYTSRDWMDKVSMIAFRFSGLQNGDTIKIDGVRFYIENPNPREIKKNVYLFPIKIYNYGVQTQDFYFYDYGKTIIFNQLLGYTFGHIERNHRSYIKFGRPSSASGNEQPMGIVFFWNTWCSGYTWMFFEGYSGSDESRKLRMQIDGVTVMSAHPTLDGMMFRGRYMQQNESYMRNSQFEEVGDWYWDYYDEVINVEVKGHRYTPLGAPSDGATLDGVKFWLNQNYMWVDQGTLRDSQIVSAREGNIWFYHRDYGATSDKTTTFIDWTFPDGFFDSSHNYQASQNSQYTSYSLILRIGNSVKIKVVDRNGIPIQGATVTCKDKDGNIAWTDTTDADGEIDKHDIIHREWTTSSGNRIIYMDTPDVYYYPYTLTITHQSYPPKEIHIPTDEKINWTVTLDDRPMSSGIIRVYGTEYTLGEEGVIYAQVLYGDGSPANNASCNVTIYNKNTIWVSNQPMTYINGSNGIYYYNFTVPLITSVFIADVVCSNPTAYGSAEFHVSNIGNIIQDINQTVSYINNTIINSIIPKLDEINSTTHSNYNLINQINLTTNYINTTIISKWSSLTAQDLYDLEQQTRQIAYYINSTRWGSYNFADVMNKWGSYSASTLYAISEQARNIINYVNATRWGSYVADDLYNISNQSKNIANDILSKWGVYNATMLYNISNQTLVLASEIRDICNVINVTVINISNWEWYSIVLSNFGSITPGNDYQAYLFVYDKDGYLVNASSTPTIKIYDASGNLVADATMVQIGDGEYGSVNICGW